MAEYQSQKLFALSVFGRENNSVNKEIKRGKDVVDLTWPFMCVSILFTKETLQAFRAGSLNNLCNERKDVLSVLADFHHACFLDFGKCVRFHYIEYVLDNFNFCLIYRRRVVANSSRHHAMHLADLRKGIETDPLAILKSFLVLKSSTSIKTTLDRLLTHQSTINGSASSNAKLEVEEDVGIEDK